MAESFEELAAQFTELLAPAEAKGGLAALGRVLTRILEQPHEAERRCWSAEEAAEAAGPPASWPLITKCLLALGFEKEEEKAGALRLPMTVEPMGLHEGSEFVTCMLESLQEVSAAAPEKDVAVPMEVEEVAARIAEKAAVTPMEDEEDPELAEALRMSMAIDSTGSPDTKRPKMANGEAGQQTDHDAEVAARLAAEEQKTVDVEFERFRGEDVLITEEAVKEINSFCAASGEPYVDPQFPPVDRSLYINEEDATTWRCFGCSGRTRLPPVPPLPTSEAEAIEVEAGFEKVVCSACGLKAPQMVKARYFNRPTQWLRPGVACPNCTATAPIEYPNVRDVRPLLEVMCTHYLRCTTTKKTLGQPWVIIRDQPRPEDVRQGALGNCWFAGALSVVAAKPELVWSLFITREHNPHGAYQLQLFHAGEWRGILIDDLFPTSQVAPGKIVGEMVYYSRGGTLSYLSCTRHQTWVPLVEKAAAKLFGCYGYLQSGTFGEALALFTGFPTERLQLYIPKEARQRRAELRDQRVAKRTEMLLRGEQPPEDDEEEDLMLDEAYQNDLLWSKLLSFREAGYLMGLGCTEQGCEKTKEQILEAGLQAPHAYGILDVRECRDAEGKIHRLVQIRNPWGEEAPRTWKGDWGKDSPKWTFDLKLKLGVVNRSNVPMYDLVSIFWMSFEDMREYFAVVDVCRVHDGWEEYRERAWLPSGVGPGEAFDLTVHERTQVDIALWQEKHITRESALGGNTNVDIGLAVLRRRGQNEDGTYEFECVQYVRRTLDDCASQEMILEGGYVYRLVPLCINQMQQYAPRRAVLVVHASNPLTLEKVASSWQNLARATWSVLAKAGKAGNILPGVQTFFLQERMGYIFGASNGSDGPFALQVDSNDSTGFVSSRQDGACGCIELIPPKSRKVIMAMAPRRGATRMELSFAYEPLPAEAAAWVGAGSEDLHQPLPLTPLASQSGAVPPDEAILHAEPPPRRRKPLSSRGRQVQTPSAQSADALLKAQQEAEDDLAEALRLSMQDSPDAVAGEPDASMEEDENEEDELARALRLSMQPAEALGGAPAAPPAAAPTAPPVEVPAAPAAAPPAASPGGAPAGPVAAGPALQQLIKELFAKYRAEGMDANTAAARAMKEAKQQAVSAAKAADAG